MFEESKTVFSLTCPAKPVSAFKRKLSLNDQDILLKDDDIANFCVPSNTFGVSIDDSKVQRKLLAKMLDMCGVRRDKTLILGESRQEIIAFETTVAKLLRDNPRDWVLAIVDENLDVDRDGDPQTVSGSRCIERLRKLLAPEEEARLLALIRSANDSKVRTPTSLSSHWHCLHFVHRESHMPFRLAHRRISRCMIPGLMGTSRRAPSRRRAYVKPLRPCGSRSLANAILALNIYELLLNNHQFCATGGVVDTKQLEACNSILA